MPCVEDAHALMWAVTATTVTITSTLMGILVYLLLPPRGRKKGGSMPPPLIPTWGYGDFTPGCGKFTPPPRGRKNKPAPDPTPPV